MSSWIWAMLAACAGGVAMTNPHFLALRSDLLTLCGASCINLILVDVCGSRRSLKDDFSVKMIFLVLMAPRLNFINNFDLRFYPTLFFMETVFAVAAVILIALSFFGLLKALLRVTALLCVIAAIFVFYTGGREVIVESFDSGKEMIQEKVSGMVENDRKLIEEALRDPSSVVGAQKDKIREISEKLLENPEISANDGARKVLEKLVLPERP